ncbi:MAG TPA: BLUF domain-containing protein [Caulobacteraceae bacterium]|nr:BLUF domain-containing protein [Caulobacteraceae bacterium]
MTQHHPLHRLIYVSRFSAAFPKERQEQDYVTSAILRASLRNNGACGVTGLLLVHRGHFMQVLEGQADAVKSIYERITQDRRHTDIRLITARRCEQRLFPDWSLCVRRVCAGDGTFIGDVNIAGAADPSLLDADAALSVLIEARQARNRVLLAAMA